MVPAIHVDHFAGDSAAGVGGSGDGAEDFDFVVATDDAREAFGVLLDPDGRVAGHAVFPGGEPEEDDADALFASLGEEAVDEGEIVAAFGGFDQIEMHGGIGDDGGLVFDEAAIGIRLPLNFGDEDALGG